MEKLKMNLQTFADEIPGFLSHGTALEIQTGGTWAPVAAVRSIPQIGSTPEQVDVTHLQSPRMASIAGLEGSENLEFTIVYQGANFASLHAVHESRAQTDFRITYPDGLQVTFTGQAVLNLAATEVNAALEFTLTVVVSEGPDFVLP